MPIYYLQEAGTVATRIFNGYGTPRVQRHLRQPKHNRNTTETQPKQNRNTTETKPSTLHPPRGSVPSSCSLTAHSVMSRRSFEPASPTKARAFSAFASAIRCASNPQAATSPTVNYRSGDGACSWLRRAALALRFLLRAVSDTRSFFPPSLTSTKICVCPTAAASRVP